MRLRTDGHEERLTHRRELGFGAIALFVALVSMLAIRAPTANASPSARTSLPPVFASFGGGTITPLNNQDPGGGGLGRCDNIFDAGKTGTDGVYDYMCDCYFDAAGYIRCEWVITGDHCGCSGGASAAGLRTDVAAQKNGLTTG